MVNKYYDENSFFGGLNLILMQKNKKFQLANTRPPFPIINDDPSIEEIVGSLNKADFALPLVVTVGGMLIGSISMVFAKAPYDTKVFQYKKFVNFCFISGCVLGLTNCIFRLEGKVPNGLKWEYKNLVIAHSMHYFVNIKQ